MTEAQREALLNFMAWVTRGDVTLLIDSQPDDDRGRAEYLIEGALDALDVTADDVEFQWVALEVKRREGRSE